MHPKICNREVVALCKDVCDGACTSAPTLSRLLTGRPERDGGATAGPAGRTPAFSSACSSFVSRAAAALFGDSTVDPMPPRGGGAPTRALYAALPSSSELCTAALILAALGSCESTIEAALLAAAVADQHMPPDTPYLPATRWPSSGPHSWSRKRSPSDAQRSAAFQHGQRVLQGLPVRKPSGAAPFGSHGPVPQPPLRSRATAATAPRVSRCDCRQAC